VTSGRRLEHGRYCVTPRFGVLCGLRLTGAVTPTYEIAELNIGVIRGL